MDTTMNTTADKSSGPAGQVKNDLGNGVRHIKDAVTGEMKNLMADVEDLVSRVADVKDPDIVRIRNKVQAALVSTRDSLVTGAEAAQRQVRQAAATTDDYVRASPWQALGIAALVGVTVGYLAGRQR